MMKTHDHYDNCCRKSCQIFTSEGVGGDDSEPQQERAECRGHQGGNPGIFIIGDLNVASCGNDVPA